MKMNDLIGGRIIGWKWEDAFTGILTVEKDGKTYKVIFATQGEDYLLYKVEVVE